MDVLFFLSSSLTSLVSLELRENMIQFLPQSMSFLVKLEILDLGSNNIKELVGVTDPSDSNTTQTNVPPNSKVQNICKMLI